MPLDSNWIESLSPDEARAALDSLEAHKGPYSVREAVELQRLKRAPQAKVDERYRYRLGRDSLISDFIAPLPFQSSPLSSSKAKQPGWRSSVAADFGVSVSPSHPP